MEIYYELFTQLEERTDDVINYVCSGMYISGKHFFVSGEEEKARDILDKTAVSSAGAAKFLKAIIVLLVEYNIFQDAQKMLSRFTNEPEDDSDFQIASYLANSSDMNTTEKISKGLELYNNGHKHPLCMQFLISALKADGADKKAEQYLEEAQHMWPKIFSEETSAA
jgi:hypothetical protein